MRYENVLLIFSLFIDPLAKIAMHASYATLLTIRKLKKSLQKTNIYD